MMLVVEVSEVRSSEFLENKINIIIVKKITHPPLKWQWRFLLHSPPRMDAPDCQGSELRRWERFPVTSGQVHCCWHYLLIFFNLAICTVQVHLAVSHVAVSQMAVSYVAVSQVAVSKMAVSHVAVSHVHNPDSNSCLTLMIGSRPWPFPTWPFPTWPSPTYLAVSHVGNGHLGNGHVGGHDLHINSTIS